MVRFVAARGPRLAAGRRPDVGSRSRTASPPRARVWVRPRRYRRRDRVHHAAPRAAHPIRPRPKHSKALMISTDARPRLSAENGGRRCSMPLPGGRPLVVRGATTAVDPREAGSRADSSPLTSRRSGPLLAAWNEATPSSGRWPTGALGRSAGCLRRDHGPPNGGASRLRSSPWSRRLEQAAGARRVASASGSRLPGRSTGSSRRGSRPAHPRTINAERDPVSEPGLSCGRSARDDRSPPWGAAASSAATSSGSDRLRALMHA